MFFIFPFIISGVFFIISGLSVQFLKKIMEKLSFFHHTNAYINFENESCESYNVWTPTILPKFDPLLVLHTILRIMKKNPAFLHALKIRTSNARLRVANDDFHWLRQPITRW